MVMENLISVIVPVYNVEKYIDRCIESITNQSYENLEILLINDGSTDYSEEICRKWEKIDSRIKVFSKENGGLSDARNFGLDICTGDFIAFVDSDDFINKDMFKIMLNLSKETLSDIVQCEFLKFKDENGIINKMEEYTIKEFTNIEAIENHYKEELQISTVVAWSKLYKRKLFNEIRFPKGKLHEDEFTTYKLLYKANKVVYTNQKLYYYRQTVNSIMNRRYNIKRLDLLEALRERLLFIDKINNESLYNIALINYYVILIFAYNSYKKYNSNDKSTLKRVRNESKKIFKELKSKRIIEKNNKIEFEAFNLNPMFYKFLLKLKKLNK